MSGSDPEMAAFLREINRRAGSRPELIATAERVLVGVSEGVSDIAALVEATGLTLGQVLQALELLAEVGFIESAPQRSWAREGL